MRAKDLLQALDLGSSVAEFDEALERHFVETDTFRALVAGKYDIVAGDKGTGKTALFRIITKRHREIPELNDVEIITAFNPTGNSIFQRLTQVPPLAEGQYATVWKTYIVSLVGNWILEALGSERTPSMTKLDELLRRANLRLADDSATTVFSRLMNYFRRLLKPKSVEVSTTLSETGIQVLAGKVDFENGGGTAEDVRVADEIPHEVALRLVNASLKEAGVVAWVMFDRLDEAFQGYPDTERPALRALLRTYLDLLEFEAIRLKVFVRKDLFRKVVVGGFVNLTHVNAKRLDIVWDEEDLLNLLARRIRGSPDFVGRLGLENGSDKAVFDAVFPAQVDAGSRKSSTWNWMMSRIRDGNGIRPPRNLIDLAKKAQEAQARSEERQSREWNGGQSLIEPESIRRALSRLSEERVNDTLLAEAADLAPDIEHFRDGKAEHNLESLSGLLGLDQAEVRARVKPLVELGFLEEIGDSFKVPIIYRDGLSITQGKAFASGAQTDESDT